MTTIKALYVLSPIPLAGEHTLPGPDDRPQKVLCWDDGEPISPRSLTRVARTLTAAQLVFWLKVFEVSQYVEARILRQELLRRELPVPPPATGFQAPMEVSHGQG